MTDKEIAELRKILEKELEVVEQQIYDLEKIYLEESATFGNIIKGWENGLNFKTHKHSMFNPQKKLKLSEKDRLFSLSSCTSPANRGLKRELEHPENQSSITPAQTNAFIKRRKIKKNKFLYPRNNRIGQRKPANDSEEEEAPSASEENLKKEASKRPTKGSKEAVGQNSQGATKNWIKASKASNMLKTKKNKRNS